MEISGCNLNTHWKWQTQPGWIARQTLGCTAACNYKRLLLYLLSEPSQRIFDKRPDSHETGNWKCLSKLVLIRDLLLGGNLRGGEALSFWQGVVLHGLPYGHSGRRAEEGHPLGCHAHSAIWKPLGEAESPDWSRQPSSFPGPQKWLLLNATWSWERHLGQTPANRYKRGSSNDS